MDFEARLRARPQARRSQAFDIDLSFSLYSRERVVATHFCRTYYSLSISNLSQSCTYMVPFDTCMFSRKCQADALSSGGLGSVSRPTLKLPRRLIVLLLESRPAIATATRDQHTRHNALLQSKHNRRSALSDHTALRNAAAWVPYPSILQRLANRQLFLLDHSRCTQGWQPGSRHLRHPSHWIEQEDQALR